MEEGRGGTIVPPWKVTWSYTQAHKENSSSLEGRAITEKQSGVDSWGRRRNQQSPVGDGQVVPFLSHPCPVPKVY